jgi:hypothetical protein
VTVTNNDNAMCSVGTFNLQANVPGGWSAVFANPSLTISPGASASTTVSVTSTTAAPPGQYSIGVTAINGSATSYQGTASAIYTVAPRPTSLTVSVSTDRSSYTLSQTVAMRGLVLVGGAPVSGVNINFIVTKSNGSLVTMKGTTGLDGSTTVKYRFNKRDPKGTYQDQASSSVNGASGSATTSFVVQ